MYSAAKLGAVTHAANNAPEVVQNTGGTRSTVIRRDSTSWPQNSKTATPQRRFASLLKRKQPSPACSSSWVSSASQAVFSARSRRQSRMTAEREQTAKRKRAADDALAAAVSSSASRLSRPAGQPPAADRMGALRERVRRRSSTASAGNEGL